MVMTTGWSDEIVLAAEPRSASLARDYVCAELGAHGLDHLIEDVRLVASELVTNGVTHAQTPLTVTLALEDESLRLSVVDSATSVPVRCAPQVTDVGGRGLWLVGVLSSDWGVRLDGDGHKTVWASFSVR